MQSPPLPDINKVTRLDLMYFNLTAGKAEDLLRSTTETEEVSIIIGFINTNLLSNSDADSEWRRISRVQDRSTILNLNLYEGDEYKGTFGVGPDGNDGFFLKYRYYDQSRVKCISNEEKKEFLELIGISEEKYQDLFKGL
jgi:hypothetical protein